MFSIHTCNFGVNDVQLIGQCFLFIYHQSIEKKDLTVVTQMLVDPTSHVSLVYPETLGVPSEGFPNAP
jgi:hypothetical protein